MDARGHQASKPRLDSWKEIAGFFGRDERTVKRWEKERALPVHRVPGGVRGGVFAYAAELSEWLEDPEGTAIESSQQHSPAEAGASSADTIREVEPAVPGQIFAAAIPARSSKFKLARNLAVLLGILLGLLVLKDQIPRQPTSAAARNIAPPVHRPNPEAEELYLKGRYFWNKRTPEALNNAVDLFTQAIVRDPGYAQAYVGLADCYNLLREYSVMPPNEAYPRALAAAKQAVKLDDASAEAHNSLAFATFYWTWDAPTAEHEFKRAIALNPGYAAAHHWYATFLMATKRDAEAVVEIEQAAKLDPASTPIMADRGYILYRAGQSQQGVALLKQVESAEPTFLSPHLYLSSVYVEGKNYSNYLTEAKRVAELRHDPAALAIVSAGERGFAADGARGMWGNMLAVQKKFYLRGTLPAYPLAQTYSQLGESQEALKYLSEAYDKRDAAIVFLKTDRSFDGLRDNSSFRDLLARSSQPRLN
jgi:tetratricopeptide (TPR) repeat protein